MKKPTLLALVALVLVFSSCKKKGCIDPAADNYNVEAEKDDGSCTYSNSGNDTSNEITEDITVPTTINEGITSICGSIDVSAELNVSPGAVIIMCSGASLNITGSGYINAVGTAADPIIIKGETESSGFWAGLAVYSNNPNNQLDYVTVKDAGSYWAHEFANLYVGSNAKLSLNNSTIANSEDVGMFVHGDGVIVDFANNSFDNNVTGLKLPSKMIGSLDANTNYDNNNTNSFIHATQSTITVDSEWEPTNTPILMHGTTSVEAGLTVKPGSDIMFEANAGMSVETTGWLSAVGTTTEMINFRGRYSTAAYWDGIAFYSNNPNNELNYLSLSDGGSYWAYEYSNVFVSGSLKVDNCNISNANNYGIYVNSSSSLTSGGSLQTTPAGVEANNTFTNNGAGPDANCTTCSVFFE